MRTHATRLKPCACAQQCPTDKVGCPPTLMVYPYTATFELPSVSMVACGEYHTIAVCQDGTIWSWGRNNYGQLGHGDTSEKKYKVPTQVSPHLSMPMIRVYVCVCVCVCIYAAAVAKMFVASSWSRLVHNNLCVRLEVTYTYLLSYVKIHTHVHMHTRAYTHTHIVCVCVCVCVHTYNFLL
jgi:alpha-tubulin suppressor-like RCC1 family protein